MFASPLHRHLAALAAGLVLGGFIYHDFAQAPPALPATPLRQLAGTVRVASPRCDPADRGDLLLVVADADGTPTMLSLRCDEPLRPLVHVGSRVALRLQSMLLPSGPAQVLQGAEVDGVAVGGRADRLAQEQAGRDAHRLHEARIAALVACLVLYGLLQMKWFMVRAIRAPAAR